MQRGVKYSLFMLWRHMRACMYSCTHFSLSVTWTSAISLTLRPLYARPKSFWYPLNRRPSGHQSRSGHFLFRAEQNSRTHFKAPMTSVQELLLNQNGQTGPTNKYRKQEKRFICALHLDITALLPLPPGQTWALVRFYHFATDSYILYRST